MEGVPRYPFIARRIMRETSENFKGDLKNSFIHPKASPKMDVLHHTVMWDDLQTMRLTLPVDSKVMDYCLRIIIEKMVVLPVHPSLPHGKQTFQNKGI